MSSLATRRVTGTAFVTLHGRSGWTRTRVKTARHSPVTKQRDDHMRTTSLMRDGPMPRATESPSFSRLRISLAKWTVRPPALKYAWFSCFLQLLHRRRPPLASADGWKDVRGSLRVQPLHITAAPQSAAPWPSCSPEAACRRSVMLSSSAGGCVPRGFPGEHRGNCWHPANVSGARPPPPAAAPRLCLTAGERGRLQQGGGVGSPLLQCACIAAVCQGHHGFVCVLCWLGWRPRGWATTRTPGAPRGVCVCCVYPS